MLDLAKILRDIDNFGRERADAFAGLREEFVAATRVIREMAEDPVDACHRIAAAKTSWLTSLFDESPDQSFGLQSPPARHAVVSVDGSQIMADKHEVALCYLINSVSIILFYGSGERPQASSSPFLGYRDSDLIEVYDGKSIRVNEKMVAVRRTVAEYNELERSIQVVSEKGIPALALFDGSLILWSLQGEPDDYKKRVLGEFKRAMDLARDKGIPVGGYVSDPGSRDFVNSMKVMLCTDSPINCDRCSFKDSPENRPCNAVEHLKDSMVFGKRLADGERSVLFTSGSKILDEYGEHRIVAFYLNVGQEIARVEIPRWVAEDRSLLEMTHAICYDQARKGRGYPVALSEAHERAVVRGADRASFYEAIERSFNKHGARVTRSMKRVSKGY